MFSEQTSSEKGDAMSDDPRIVHVASELSVPLGPEAENDGNREYVIDVIAAVDYANEMCDRDFAAGVQAARDAVAVLPAYYAIEECQGNPLEKGDPEDPDPWKQGHLIERDDALAAIDGALRGES